MKVYVLVKVFGGDENPVRYHIVATYGSEEVARAKAEKGNDLMEWVSEFFYAVITQEVL